MFNFNQTTGDRIIEVLSKAESGLTVNEIVPKLNEELDSNGYGPLLVKPEVSQLPQVYQIGDKYFLKDKKYSS